MTPALSPEPVAAEEDAGIWLSVGDLMSGLLLVFVLLFVVAILQLQDYIEQSEDRRVVIIHSLQEQLDANRIEAALDAETGDISIADSVLFEEGEFELLPEGKETLNAFIPLYSEVIFSEPYIEEEIVRIVLEGHTSSLGLSHDNMALSLKRANSVAEYILTGMEFEHKEGFVGKLLASGRGEIDANPTQDDPTDRRVLFRFKFKGQDFGEWRRQAEVTP